jgi:hypothetical protein
MALEWYESDTMGWSMTLYFINLNIVYNFSQIKYQKIKIIPETNNNNILRIIKGIAQKWWNFDISKSLLIYIVSI